MPGYTGLDAIAYKHNRRFKVRRDIHNELCSKCGGKATQRDLENNGMEREHITGVLTCSSCILGDVEQQDKFTRERILSHDRVSPLGLAV
jgi:hypothetical protein